MQGKKDKQFLFTTELHWKENQMGRLSVKETTEDIVVDMPVCFGGKGAHWSPEQLFLASISSCFMATYLSFAAPHSLADFYCTAIGQVEKIGDVYRFTHINLYPIVYIATESKRAAAQQALEKTHQHCLVTQSVSALVYYHSEIKVLTGSMVVNEHHDH
jgi:organic hydroperoxide reductase OsmC/OhrA